MVNLWWCNDVAIDGPIIDDLGMHAIVIDWLTVDSIAIDGFTIDCLASLLMVSRLVVSLVVGVLSMVNRWWFNEFTIDGTSIGGQPLMV